MNIVELEEGLRNLIATQPTILSGANAPIISGINSIIESHKTFLYEVERYPEQDILKIGLTNEANKLEMNLTSYVCQILQERGINIMLYVPKYAAVYNQPISKYVEEVIFDDNSAIEENIDDNNFEENKKEIIETKIEDKSVVQPIKVEEQPSKSDYKMTSKSEGRDYLMNLLKK